MEGKIEVMTQLIFGLGVKNEINERRNAFTRCELQDIDVQKVESPLSG